MELILIFAVIFAIIGAIMAESRGRNKIGWALGGFLFGVFAILLIAVLGKTNEKLLEEKGIM